MPHSTNVPEALATPNDLNNQQRDQIAEAVNSLVADAFALFVKTKNFHWHMSGPHYRDYHLLLDEQASQIFAMIDVLAERLRKIGKKTIHSIAEIARLQRVHDNEEDFVAPEAMLSELMADNKAFTTRMRAAHEVCSNGRDVATTSLLENFIDESEQRTWFLFETVVK